MTTEGEGDDAEGVQDGEDGGDVVFSLEGLVGDILRPVPADGDGPDEGAVSDGGDGAHQRDAGDRVEIGQLRQHQRQAQENQVPLHGRQRHLVAGVAADHPEEQLHRASAYDDERSAVSSRQIHCGELRQAQPQLRT